MVGALLDLAGHHRLEGTSGGVAGGAVPPAPAPSSPAPFPIAGAESFEINSRFVFDIVP